MPENEGKLREQILATKNLFEVLFLVHEQDQEVGAHLDRLLTEYTREVMFLNDKYFGKATA